jgi:hypothetical protein
VAIEWLTLYSVHERPPQWRQERARRVSAYSDDVASKMRSKENDALSDPIDEVYRKCRHWMDMAISGKDGIERRLEYVYDQEIAPSICLSWGPRKGLWN